MSKTIFILYEFICRRACKKKKFKSKFPVLGWFLDLQNMDVFLKNLLQSKFRNNFQAEIILQSPCLLILFHMVWKNQEIWDPWLVGFWINRHLKMPKISANNFFSYLSHHYGFTNDFEIRKKKISNLPRGVSTCKILPF